MPTLDASSGAAASRAVLAALRRPGDEAQLTRVLASVAATDRRVAAAMAHAFVNAAEDSDAKRTLGEAPAEVICRPEVSLAALDEAQSHGRVDLRFDSPSRDFSLLVELKLLSPYGHDQVGRYQAALAELPDDDRRTGLLAVTRDLPTIGEPDLGRDGWLGSVRWTAVLDGLRDLPIEDADLQRQWRVFLDLVYDQGDFGMELDRDQVYGWATYVHTRRQLEQLIEALAGPALEHLQQTLAKRDAWREVSPEAIAEPYFRGKERKVAYPTQTTVHARFRLPAGQPQERLRIQFLGGFDKPYFTVEARRSGGARLVAGRGIGHKEFIRATKALKDRLDPDFRTDDKFYWGFSHGPGDWLETGRPVAEALLDLAKADVTALAESGILDPDSGFEEDLTQPVPLDEPAEE